MRLFLQVESLSIIQFDSELHAWVIKYEVLYCYLHRILLLIISPLFYSKATDVTQLHCTVCAYVVPVVRVSWTLAALQSQSQNV